MRRQTGETSRRHRTQLSDEVAAQLRATIMSGALRPGAFIRLDETARRLGVSITPVREALLKLRGEGLVRLEPHRGHVVLPLTRQDIADIFWLQATIAQQLATAATDRITDDEITELEQITESLAAAVASGDAGEITTVEFSFHRVINRASGRVKLARFLLHASRYLPELFYATDPDWGVAAVDNHRRLTAALRRRDTAAVVELTRWQFDDAARRLTEQLTRVGIWD